MSAQHPSLADQARYSAAGLLATRAFKRSVRWLRHFTTAGVRGSCPICQGATRFVQVSQNPRDGLLCVGCGSTPRHRALANFLGNQAGQVDVHESSPSIATYYHFKSWARRYTASYYYPRYQSSKNVGVFRNIDLTRQAFADESFDLVVTQDVFEHIPRPFDAFSEIARTLRPGGKHVFTVPRQSAARTVTRATMSNQAVQHLLPPDYHRDPISSEGSLVFTDWGQDLAELIAEHCAISCVRHSCRAPSIGVLTPIEVFVSQRAKA